MKMLLFIFVLVFAFAGCVTRPKFVPTEESSENFHIEYIED